MVNDIKLKMEEKILINYKPHTVTFYNNKLFDRFTRITESLKDLYIFIEASFPHLRDTGHLKNLLPILHFTIQREIGDPTATEPIEIGSESMLHLLQKHKGDEQDQRIVVQIFYQMLHSLNESAARRVHITEKLLNALCDLLFECESRALAINIVHCLKLFVHTFERVDYLTVIWKRMLTFKEEVDRRPRLTMILALLIDDFLNGIKKFYLNHDFSLFLQTLIMSDLREDRMNAFHAMRKMISVCIRNAKNVPSWEVDNSPDYSTSWTAYMRIMENLDEKQTHVILSSLTSIKSIKLNKIWLDLLYEQLLQHHDLFVQRWTVVYFLTNFKCVDLRVDQLRQLLHVANNTNFYDYDNYFIAGADIEHFVDCNLKQFLCLFSEIIWKPVPLHFWLQHINVNATLMSMSNKTLMQIAARVRVLQHRPIRRSTIEVFMKTFALNIETLNIVDHLKLITHLCNASDTCFYTDVSYPKLFYIKTLYSPIDLKVIATKLRANRDMLKHIKFTKSIYEILFYNIRHSVDFQDLLLEVYENVPLKNHDWFRFLAVFYLSNAKQITFCQTQYGIDLSAVENVNDFKDKLSDKLVWQNSDTFFVHEKAVDYFVLQKYRSYKDIVKAAHALEDLLLMGGLRTMLRLSQFIQATDEHIDLNVLQCFIRGLVKYKKYASTCYTVAENLLVYCKRCLPDDKASVFADELFDLDENCVTMAIFFTNVPITNIEKLLDRIIEHKTSIGVARIEERYCFELSQMCDTLLYSDYCINYISKLKNVEMKTIYEMLLQKNAKISAEKPYYFENSTEHRKKIRIANIIAALMKATNKNIWLDDYWKVILVQQNHPNITYIYERIIGSCLQNINQINPYLDEISKFTPKQQVSIITISYVYSVLNWSSLAHKKSITEKILPHTMSANTETRLYAQLVVYKLLTRSGKQFICYYTNELVSTLKNALGADMNDLLNDIRLDIESNTIYDYANILFVTDAPFDEIPKISAYTKSQYLKYKQQFNKIKTDRLRKQDLPTAESINQQTHYIPSMDIITRNDLLSYPDCQEEEKENNVIVVATLMDKLSNMGAIARTCEVLGIRKLVLGSMKYVRHAEFKKASMTAEKGLSISEVNADNLMHFLIEKQVEGYKILGAEQTLRSGKFVEFKYPKKCVLLLGHELDGMPCDFYSMLDHTIQIPQFGAVRSLNVHVSGALFIWEYCKQHIAR